MTFSSFPYLLLFLPVAWLVWRLAALSKVAKMPQACFLLASLIFYSQTRFLNLVFLFGSILANWLLARWISAATPAYRKRVLQVGLVANVAFLSTFKYLAFFARSLPRPLREHIHVPDLAFPLGISFFTISQIMYLVDCYEGLQPPSSLLDHATFVSFFPYIISGPIAKAKRMLHQFNVLNHPADVPAELIARGLYLFAMGLAKKAVIASSFSAAADFGFSRMTELSTFEAWAFAFSYAMQIYFDFSGYSDMAMGTAMLFGIEIPRNFDAPYRSLSIIEYWQRFHISLTNFITTYLYTPIVKSFRKVTLATSAFATVVAMTIAGLWHGAAWTFVVFGLMHGAALAINQIWRKKKYLKLPPIVSWGALFAFVLVAFAVFRSPDMVFAGKYLGRMLPHAHALSVRNLRSANGLGMSAAVLFLPQVFGCVAAFYGKSTDTLQREFVPNWRTCVVTISSLLVAMLYMCSFVARPFVYFAF